MLNHKSEYKQAWKFLKNTPKSIRTNPNILDGVRTALNRGLKSVDEVVNYAQHPAITERTITHIFRGDIGGGRHHISAILNDNVRRLVERVNETSEGFYGAVFATGGRKSFWPDQWDEFKIIDELKHVYNNSNHVGGNRYRGYTQQGGQLIEYYLGTNGHIISAFPVLPNFP